MHEKDDLDLLLDSALASYADPGREAGLERRVLAALATAQNLRVPGSIFARSRRWMPWAIALSAAASLLVWISIANVKHVPSVETGAAPLAQRAPSESHVPAEQPDALKGHDLSRAKKTAKSMKASAPGGRISESPPTQNSARLPKLNTFPRCRLRSLACRAGVTTLPPGAPVSRR